ncbi:interleukin-17 receptor C [Lates calcarifer]|uniref:Interleukin-17 receptor C n=1 Tax=Lates calcarifer TaxID=8187 RepID=A0A4W6ETR7_LATCA|nr:interleukin-17 receptor C [Lates calcarifer]
MFLHGWSVWVVLLILRMSACGLKISGYDGDEVICSQGLSGCVMKDEIFPRTESNVDVPSLTANFKLCSKNNESCSLCLEIDAELGIRPDKDMEDEGHSGLDEEDDGEESRNPKALRSVTVCYQMAPTMPTCKKVEFTVNHTALTQQNQTKISMVIAEPSGVFFSSKVYVYPFKLLHLTQEVVAPSLDEVCSQKLRKCENKCRVPKLSFLIHKERNYVELQFDGMNNNSLPNMCVQYEKNGTCQSWNRRTMPLYSVTHCMCLQTWYDQEYRRSQHCLFKNKGLFQRNVWENVTVSLGQRQTNNDGTMLLWNLSAPCRLESEVWPCQKEVSCREKKGFRQQLGNGTWKQNSKGLWEITGTFEGIDLQPSPCVMVKVEGMGRELGPFCFTNTDRWRWSLLVVGVMMLVCLTVLIIYLLRDFIKKWVWSCHHGGFVKIGRKGRVVLLSPPDVDDSVSQSVGRLGSLLRNQDFNVSVDQWSRREQCALGPLPWLHSQLLELSQVVVVLTHRALERTEEWACQHKEVIKTKGEDMGLPQIWSPYSDVFTASLCLIQAYKQQGRAAERFVLVKFDSHPTGRNLPELLQGLPLFQLPSQTQALLTELTVGRTGGRSPGKTWTGWKWGGSDGWRAQPKKGPNQQKESLHKYLGTEKNLETEPLKHP